MKENGGERLARRLAGIPDKQVAMVIAMKSMAQKTCFVDIGLDINLLKDACSRIDQAGMWMPERVLEHPAVADEQPFFSEVLPE